MREDEVDCGSVVILYEDEALKLLGKKNNLMVYLIGTSEVGFQPIDVTSSEEEDPSEDAPSGEAPTSGCNEGGKKPCNDTNCGLCIKRKNASVWFQGAIENEPAGLCTKRTKLWSGQSSDPKTGKSGKDLNLPWEQYLLDNPMPEPHGLEQKMIFAGLASDFVGVKYDSGGAKECLSSKPEGETGHKNLIGVVASPTEPLGFN